MIKSTFKYIGPCIALGAFYLAFNLFQAQILFQSHQYSLQDNRLNQEFRLSKLSDLYLRDQYLEFVRNIYLGNDDKINIYHQVFTEQFNGYLEPNRHIAHFLLQKKEHKKALQQINLAIDNHPYFYVNYLLMSEIEKSLNIDFKKSLHNAKKLQLRNQHFREDKQLKGY